MALLNMMETAFQFSIGDAENPPNFARRIYIGYLFQFSIGDARFCLYGLRRAGAASVSILYWRCEVRLDGGVQGGGVETQFQFSIGDARFVVERPKRNTRYVFQFSIGDALA